MNLKTIRSEVRSRVEAAIVLEQPIEKSKMVSSIVRDYCQDIEGDDDRAAVTRIFLYECAWDLLSAQIRAVKASKEADPRQTEMPFGAGFERLQAAYSIERDGKQYLLALRSLSNAEIDRLAAAQEAQGQGHFKHRDELLRYKRERMAIYGGTLDARAHSHDQA